VSAFAGFPPEVIVVAVRWYLRFNLSYRDVETHGESESVHCGRIVRPWRKHGVA
jgi:transposase-like protein